MVIALTDVASSTVQLARIGFMQDLRVGQRVLPAPQGPRSQFNAEGDWEVHRDQPKETRVTHQIEWEWEEFHGPYDRVTQRRIVDVTREVYPRTRRPPPSVELTVVEAATGAKAVVAPKLTYSAADEEALLHTANLFLELFGRASLLTENLEPYLPVDVHRVNWEVLPPGEMPWPQLEERMKPILEGMGERERPVYEHRLKTFTEQYPSDFVAAGRAGFSGYVVFGYEDKAIYVVESVHYGNATYVFGENWEQLSQMTKAEILNNDLHRDRIIHVEGWDARIRELVA